MQANNYKTHKEYRTAWDESYQTDPPIPLNIDIELASLCNLRCPFCFISDGSFENMIAAPADDGKSRRRLMPKEMAFKIIDQAAEIGVPALKFNWRGESTLHPDYSEILQYASQKALFKDGSTRNIEYKSIGAWNKSSPDEIGPSFLDLLVNTNANCPDRAIDGLMATTKCMVSLDSMNPTTYNVMRRGGDLSRACEVITELVKSKHPNLWIRRVLTKENENEDFFGQVRKAWGDSVKISEHYCFDRNKASSHETVSCEHDEFKNRTYCGYPSQRIIITSAGYVYPCCIDLHETMRVGDFNKQTIMEIWNGESMQTLRKDLRENNYISEACIKCESWMSYKAPQRKFVQDVEVVK